MSLRQLDFVTGIETSSSPAPGTPSADTDLITKGYADDTYALRSSWYDSQTSNNNIRAIAVADRAHGQVVFQSTSGSFFYFDSGSSATDDDATVLQPSVGTGRWLSAGGGGNASGDKLIQQFDGYATGVTAGEALSIRDALCQVIHNGTGSDRYRFFKADADNGARRSFVGFSQAAATVTPEISTYTISAAFVSGNTITTTLNGRTYVHTYASSSDATLQAIATSLAADDDIDTAVVSVIIDQTGTDDRTITLTSLGGLSFTCSAVVTGGASQPTVTVSETQAGSGGTVDLQTHGPLDGFTSLTPGMPYYLSTTAGAITATPTDGAPIYVGYALDADTLMVQAEDYLPGFNQVFIRSHGSAGASNSLTGGTAETLHFNFTSWFAGTSDSQSQSAGGIGESYFNGDHIWVDGSTTAPARTAYSKKYNRSSWSTFSTRSTAKGSYGCATFLSKFCAFKGIDNAGVYYNTLETWNGSSWTSEGGSGANVIKAAASIQGSYLRYVGGLNDSAVALNVHLRWDGSSFTTDTVYPVSTPTSVGSRTLSGNMIIGGIATSSTASYQWSGSSWSSSITMSNSVMFNGATSAAMDGPSGAGYNSASGYAYVNGGFSSGDAAITTSQKFNGTSWSSDTASTTAKGMAMSGVL